VKSLSQLKELRLNEDKERHWQTVEIKDYQ